MTTEPTTAPLPNRFVELASINVNPHVEKKGKLSYLSWAWAVDQLLRRDPDASWSYGEPMRYGNTMMVVCTVTAFGTPRTMQLPVMNHLNKAIDNPDAFAVNTAMQRCLVKAIALHGLGLYIYAGEDVPTTENAETDTAELDAAALQKLRDAAINGTESLREAWSALDERVRQTLKGELAGLKKAAAECDAPRTNGEAVHAA